jgi:hypothetical protein
MVYGRLLVDVDFDFELYHDLTLAGVDAAMEGAYAADGRRQEGVFLRYGAFQAFGVGPDFGAHAEFEGFNHIRKEID